MDKNYLQEHNLIDAHKQFKKLYEYTFWNGNDLTNEDENDDMSNDNMSNDIPNDSDDSSNDMSLDNGSGDQNNMGDDINMPDMGDDINQDTGNSQGVQGLYVKDNNDDNNDVDTEKEGDEVIDVDDLTKSQEDTETKVDDLSDKFEKLFKAINNFDDIITRNNDKIEDLKAEIERRNPTQIEKMSMQTQNSYPFNVTPNQYWNEKEKTSNYRTDYDDNGQNQGQYVITKDDVNNAVDWKSISDSLDDDELHQDIKSIFGI